MKPGVLTQALNETDAKSFTLLPLIPTAVKSGSRKVRLWRAHTEDATDLDRVSVVRHEGKQ